MICESDEVEDSRGGVWVDEPDALEEGEPLDPCGSSLTDDLIVLLGALPVKSRG